MGNKTGLFSRRFHDKNAFSNVPYTMAYVDEQSVSEDPSVIDIKIENVILKQEPSEVCDLEIVIKRSNPIRKQLISYYHYEVTRIEMKFRNNLHEMSVFPYYYIYEVQCDQSRYGFQDPLFLFGRRRRANAIKGGKIGFVRSVCLKNNEFYFYIRRLSPFLLIRSVPAEKNHINFASLLRDVPTDVNVLVGDQHLHAHKVVLYGSDVFKAMFVHDMSERKMSAVEITDFSVDVIKEMLDFMYTGKIGNVEIRYQLFKAAHKYQVRDLCYLCEEYIVFNSNVTNIVETMELAEFYELEHLSDMAMAFVGKHEEEILKESKYEDYLCRSLALNNAVYCLKMAKRNRMKNLKGKALDFIGRNFRDMKDDEAFSSLYASNPKLMKEIVDFYCENYAPAVESV